MYNNQQRYPIQFRKKKGRLALYGSILLESFRTQWCVGMSSGHCPRVQNELKDFKNLKKIASKAFTLKPNKLVLNWRPETKHLFWKENGILESFNVYRMIP